MAGQSGFRAMQPADPGLVAERERASDLVRRIQAGEREAEVELVKHYSRGLKFLLRRRTGDRQLADDFLQETWAVALARIRDRGLEQPERLAGFLTGIANNLVQSDWRRVERPRAGCALLLRRFGAAYHDGLAVSRTEMLHVTREIGTPIRVGYAEHDRHTRAGRESQPVRRGRPAGSGRAARLGALGAAGGAGPCRNRRAFPDRTS